MKKNLSVHAGHRERMLRNYLAGGRLTDIQKVEVFLFYCFRQGDTNVTAHHLLDKFGTIEALLHAGEAEIASVKGMGPASAHKLRTILDTVLEYRELLRIRRNNGEWRYNTVCAYLTERILPRLLRNDIGCVAVILKEGMKSDSYNLSDTDIHLIKAIGKQKSEGDLYLICILKSVEGYVPLSDENKAEYVTLGVDAVAVISPMRKIEIDILQYADTDISKEERRT